ncbi:MAG TPA: hypothetical protein VGP92_13845 [Acidimicrobiia bacterium]|nr:hypothetical protein [Acidimicrobiia bacterium]
MTRHSITLGSVVLALTLGGACGANRNATAHTVKVADAAPPTGRLLLAEFTHGIGAVSAGTPTPVWLDANAVAAADGSSVFSIHLDGAGGNDSLVRLDPATGAVRSSWPLADRGLSVSAVAPNGQWIAMTNRRTGYGDQHRSTTTLVVFDTQLGKDTRRLELKGDVQPEAFSTDGAQVFALDYRGDHYRVQTIALDTQQRYDTSDRDKRLPPEDMHGQPVHGVMGADRTLLATLYRNPGNAKEPAFVHVLDLVHAYSYCADLPAPFGTGAPGTDAIELTSADTVVVAATEAARLAEIRIEDVHQLPDKPVRVSFRSGTISLPDAAFRSMAGFEFVIAPVAAAAP